MGKIFYLMGKSSSGKDTIYKKLLENKELNLKTIVLYTTRPIRSGERDGVEYFFVDEKKRKEFENNKSIIECRSYETIHGIWNYFTVDDNQIDLSKNNYLIMGTLESYEKIKNYFGEDKLVPIYVEVEEGVRLQRALDREKIQDNPKYMELCRRFLADEKDFSKKNINNAKILKVFRNMVLEECLKEITEYIKENNYYN